MAVVNFVTEPIIYCSKCERNRDLDEIDQVYHFDAVSNNTGTRFQAIIYQLPIFNQLPIFMIIMLLSSVMKPTVTNQTWPTVFINSRDFIRIF